MNALRVLASRFKEPSSWAGLAGILALVGLSVDGAIVEAVTYIGAGLAGLVAVFLPEAK